MTATITDAPRISNNNGTASRRRVDRDDEPRVEKMTISPTMALNWLEHANTQNRTLSDAHVQRLARDMKHGRWMLTHAGIAFDSSGALLDGQHRLWAIAEADVPVTMHVWFNIPRESLMVLDTGRARSLPDLLRLGGCHGHVTRDEMAVLRAMLGGYSGPVALSSSEASDAMFRHRKAVAFAIEVLPRAKWVANATTRAVIGRAYYSVDHQKLTEFGQMLSTGMVTDGTASSIVLLRSFLMENVGNRPDQRRQRYGKTQRALLAYLRRQPITRLYAATEEHFLLPGEDQRG